MILLELHNLQESICYIYGSIKKLDQVELTCGPAVPAMLTPNAAKATANNPRNIFTGCTNLQRENNAMLPSSCKARITQNYPTKVKRTAAIRK